ncbi:hypothetical protein SAMN02745729_1354 [Marinobacterium iners DSM 11526]|uniref:Uncharacterized protein n=1 Tax=Marinobacterium iners DSM 11526 TaxID=1122198 RepID=A0A1H4HBQ1_9GAMM|nr:hypothetical protein SAMN02745729_1354 [Marinobacterium iners DSM 11526]
MLISLARGLFGLLKMIKTYNKALKIGRCAPWDLNSYAISAL